MYNQKSIVLPLIFFTLLKINLFSQEVVEENKFKKNSEKYLSFEKGYVAFKNGDYNLAKKVFGDIIDNDKWGHNYDVNPFLAETYYRLGQVDSAKAIFTNAIIHLEDLHFFYPKEEEYKFVLEKLKKWKADFPKFPQELLEENGFVPYHVLPEPKNGWDSIRKKLDYPKSLKKSHLQGNVTVQVLINEEGKPIEFKVVDSFHPEAEEAAINSIKKVEWTIPKTRGRVARLWVQIPIKFRL